MVQFNTYMVGPSLIGLKVADLDVIRYPGWGVRQDMVEVDTDGYDLEENSAAGENWEGFQPARDYDEDYSEQEIWDDEESERREEVAWERASNGRLERTTMREIIQEAEDRRQAAQPRQSIFIDLTTTPDFEYIDMTLEDSEEEKEAPSDTEWHEALTGIKRPRSPRDPDADGWIETKRPKH